MPGLFLPKTILGISSIWFLTLGLMILAIIMLIVASKKLAKDSLAYDIVKDIAIAFLAAAIVTITYDSVLDFRRVSDLFSLVIGDDVRPEILDSTKVQIFDREVIRENAELRFRVRHDDKLPKNQAVLDLEIGYDLYGLKPEGFNFTVQQELENIYMRNEALNLPRFNSVTVGNKLYTNDELKAIVEKGLLTLKDIPVKPWPRHDSDSSQSENTGIRIVTERSEIIYLPGTYNIVLSQLTKGVKVHIDSPPDIEHTLKRWFNRGGQDFQPAGKYHNYSGIVLPGQSVSFQFRSLTDSKTEIPKTAGTQ